MDGISRKQKGGQARREDSRPFAGVLDTLVALEARIQAIEDKVTGGYALELPAPPQSRIRERREASLEAMEAALLVGTMARRMNLRLGAIERGLEFRRPLGLDSGIALRSTRRLKMLETGEAVERSVLHRGANSRSRSRAN